MAVSTMAYSANITSSQSGDWGSTSTWSCACIPTSADDVTIKHTVTSSGANQAGSISLGTSWGPRIAGILNITGGNLSITNGITIGINGQSDGAISISSGATLNFGGAMGWQQAAAINVYGTLNGGSFSVANGNGGNFNVYSDGEASFTGDVYISSGPHNFNIDGDLDIGDDLEMAGAGSMTVSGTGNVSVADEMNIAYGGQVSNNGTMSAASCTNANCPGSVTLPVRLVSFTTSIESGYVALEWSTAIEINNEYFTLERSIGKEEFTGIVVIDGNGNTDELKTYYWEDYGVESGLVYYRLSQTDFDGTTEVIALKSVNFDNATGDFDFYPNPVGWNRTIHLSGEIPDKVVLYDQKGSIIMEQATFEPTIELPADITKGHYLIRFISERSSTTKHLLYD